MENQDPETRVAIGAAMEVHKNLGPGFLEAVYQEALAEEFSIAQPPIPFSREVELPIHYKEKPLKTRYRVDFICFSRTLLLELKAKQSLGDEDRSQILHYLKATGITKGLLLNFGAASLQFERFIFTK
jgi:GxxExxY protein